MIKNYITFIKEAYGDEIKDDLATVIDIEQRQKDVDDIKKKIDLTNEDILKKKEVLKEQIEKLEKIETSDYTDENKKLLQDKIEKYKEDLKNLDEMTAKFGEEIEKLKK